MSYKIETTLETLEQYRPLDRRNRKKNDELLAVRVKNGVEFLTKIDRSEVTCWNLFLRIFNQGILAHTHISMKRINHHLVSVFRSSDFKEEHKIGCDSQAYKTVCKIRDWAWDPRINQFLTSSIEFQVQGPDLSPYPIRYTFEAPKMQLDSLLECEKKLREEAFLQRQHAISELQKYYLDCRDIVSFEGIPTEPFEEFLKDRKIQVGQHHGIYVPNSYKYQLAKILKPSDHQAPVRRIPGRITNRTVEHQLKSVDAQRATVAALTVAAASVPQQGNYVYPMVNVQVAPPRTFSPYGGAYYPNGTSPYTAPFNPSFGVSVSSRPPAAFPAAPLGASLNGQASASVHLRPFNPAAPLGGSLNGRL